MWVMIRTKLTLGCFCLVWGGAVFAAPATGWLQTAAGTYDFNDTANWVDGEINGVFGTDLGLAGNQTITISADVSVPQLQLNYGGKYAISLVPDGARTLTITDGGSIEDSHNQASNICSIGNPDSPDDLVIDFGNNPCRVNVKTSNYLHLRAKLVNDASFAGDYGFVKEGAGLVALYGTPAYTGDAQVTGGTMYFMVAGTLPEGTIKLESGTCAASSAAVSASSIQKKLATDSAGVLAFRADEAEADIDLSAYPDLSLGLSGGSECRVTGGTIKPYGGVYKFDGAFNGSNKIIYFDNAAILDPTADIEVSNAARVYMTYASAMTGTVTVNAGAYFGLMGDGQLQTADVVLNRGWLNLSGNVDSDVTRVQKVTSNAGAIYFQGASGKTVVHRIGELVLSTADDVGGVPRMKWGGGKKATILRVGKVTRTYPVVLDLIGSASDEKSLVLTDLGTTGLESGFHILFDDGSASQPGADRFGTTAAPVVPWVRAWGLFLCYDDERGFRALDGSTEVQTYSETATRESPETDLENLYLTGSAATTLTFSQDVTLGSVRTGYGSVRYTLATAEGAKVNVPSGAMFIDGNTSPYLSAVVDFGTARGYITERQGKGQSFDGTIAGSGGLTIANYAQANSTSSGGSGLTCSFKDSTFTGDVHIFDRVDAVQNGCFPAGADRPGNVYLHGFWLCGNYSVALNGLYGHGYMQLGNGYTITYTFGSDGSDGDYDGRIYRTNGTFNMKKVGAGRQRFGGSCNHNGTTVVEAGTLQVDGVFSQYSALTVNTGATLAGSGSFPQTGKTIMMQDGAVLEAGSTKTENQTMAIAGNLTLQGAASLNLVCKDGETLGAVEVDGVLTIPADKRITVNVLKPEDGNLKSGVTHTVLTSATALSRDNFARGTNCGPLKLSADGRHLLMTVNTGFAVIVR